MAFLFGSVEWVSWLVGHLSDGTIDINEENPEASSVQGAIDVASLRTGLSVRDRSLWTAGRFDAKRFPTMSFRSTRVGDFEGDSFKVYGELTIKEFTCPVVFDVVNKGEAPTENGRRRWAFSASIVLNRRDWKIEWNPLIELGGLLIGTDVRGAIEILAVGE